MDGNWKLQQYLPFTVLKLDFGSVPSGLYYWLQQYLPFTVLKPVGRDTFAFGSSALQQYLPFTVLKRYEYFFHFEFLSSVATVLTVYGIETF